MKRGQITAEFVVITALVSFIFLMVVSVISHERKAAAQGIWETDAQNNADRLAEAINSVYLAGPGATLNLTLPKTLVGGINYTVTVRDRLATISVQAYGREFERKFLTGGIEDGSPGLNITPGSITLSNLNGTVRVSAN
jgi:hypothetical protein